MMLPSTVEHVMCAKLLVNLMKIPPAPLHPIPAIGEPFERILIDCVGPLPRTKSGHQYLLTIMCTATRYPEAVPLRRITVSKALIKFTVFGLPRVVQTDQGSNFMSRVFSQVLKQLSIQHYFICVSSRVSGSSREVPPDSQNNVAGLL